MGAPRAGPRAETAQPGPARLPGRRRPIPRARPRQARPAWPQPPLRPASRPCATLAAASGPGARRPPPAAAWAAWARFRRAGVGSKPAWVRFRFGPNPTRGLRPADSSPSLPPSPLSSPSPSLLVSFLVICIPGVALQLTLGARARLAMTSRCCRQLMDHFHSAKLVSPRSLESKETQTILEGA